MSRTADVLALCYHRVSPTRNAFLSVSEAELATQMRLLRARGYRGAPFTDAVSGAVDGKVLAITFDDGDESVLTRAFPILSTFGFVGSVYVSTDDVFAGADQSKLGEQPHPNRPPLTPMTWDQLRFLTSQGWEIGSHACTHQFLTRLDDEALRRELVESRAVCEEQLGKPCRSIAYPNGDVDQRVINATRLAGYVAGGALPSRARPAIHGDPLAWPRIGVYDRDTPWRFRLKVSPVVRRARRHPSWDALQRLVMR